MKLQKIISLANRDVEISFIAMERSLRATGCELPLWVIPYDDLRFDLPPNAQWWEDPEILGWLQTHNAHPTLRKLQCLTTSHYQFVDTDVIFLRNPENVLANHTGWITSCGHWNNPGHTYTSESLSFFKKTTTVWQHRMFNVGQFASDQALYTHQSLIETVESQPFFNTCLNNPFEQAGINMLVFNTSLPVTNLTLPPYSMESTWAGDYTDNFSKYWKAEEKKPYLIHWAGKKMNPNDPISILFFQYLNKKEKAIYLQQLSLQKKSLYDRIMRIPRALRSAFRAFKTSLISQ